MVANLRVLAGDDVSGTRKPRRRWRDKFGEALRGIKLGVRGQSSFFVHFFVATLVAVAAVILQCDWFEWCLLIGCIGLVLTAELFNGAIETLFRGFEPAVRNRHFTALDISAGAVLVASATAAIIGVIVFAQRSYQFLAPAH